MNNFTWEAVAAVNPIVFLDIDGVLCTRMAAGWPRHAATLVKGGGCWIP